MISHMWNLKNDTNEPIYKTETDSQTLRTDLWSTKEKGGRGRDKLGGWDRHMHTTIYKIGN